MSLTDSMDKEGIEYDLEDQPFKDYIDIEARIEDLRIEVDQAENSIYNMSHAMEEQGFDGDFDPIAPLSRRIDEANVLMNHYGAKQAEYRSNMSEKNQEALDELDEIEMADAEIDYEWQNERRQMGIY